MSPALHPTLTLIHDPPYPLLSFLAQSLARAAKVKRLVATAKNDMNKIVKRKEEEAAVKANADAADASATQAAASAEKSRKDVLNAYPTLI